MALALADTTFTLDDAALGEWANGLTTRIGLQSELVWVGLNDGYTDAGGKDVAIPYLGLYWLLGPVKTAHCQSCWGLALDSPYDPPGTPGGKIIYQSPGDGHTECGAGCKCWLEYGLPSVSLPRNYAWNNLLPGPGAATREIGAQQLEREAQQRAQAAKYYSWQEAVVLNPESEYLTTPQREALDYFRAKWFAWEDVRGDLPQLPQMFAEADAAQSLQDLDMFLNDMNDQQRGIFFDIQDAIGQWNEATAAANEAAGAEGATGAADEQVGMAETLDDGTVRLFGFGGFRIGGGSRGALGGLGGHFADGREVLRQSGGRFNGSTKGAQHEHESQRGIHEHIGSRHSEEGGGGGGGRSEKSPNEGATRRVRGGVKEKAGGAKRAAKPKQSEQEKITAKREGAIAKAQARIDAAHKSGDAKEMRLAHGALKRANALPKNVKEANAQREMNARIKAERESLKAARDTIARAAAERNTQAERDFNNPNIRRQGETPEQFAARFEAGKRQELNDYIFEHGKEYALQGMNHPDLSSWNKAGTKILPTEASALQPHYASPKVRDAAIFFAREASASHENLESSNVIDRHGNFVSPTNHVGTGEVRDLGGGQLGVFAAPRTPAMTRAAQHGGTDIHSHPNPLPFSTGRGASDWRYYIAHGIKDAIVTTSLGEHGHAIYTFHAAKLPSLKQWDAAVAHVMTRIAGERPAQDVMNQEQTVWWNFHALGGLAKELGIDFGMEIVPNATALTEDGDDTIQLFGFGGFRIGGGARPTGGLGGHFADGREVLRQSGGRFNGSTKGAQHEHESQRGIHEHIGARHNEEGGGGGNRTEKSPNNEASRKITRGERKVAEREAQANTAKAQQEYERQRAAYKQTHDDSPLGQHLPFTREQFAQALPSGKTLGKGRTAETRLVEINGERYVAKRVVGFNPRQHTDAQGNVTGKETATAARYREANAEVAGNHLAKIVGLGESVAGQSLIMSQGDHLYNVQSFERGSTLSRLSNSEMAKWTEANAGAAGAKRMLFEYMVGRVDGHEGNYLLNSATGGVKIIDFGNDFTGNIRFNPLQTMTGRAVLATHGGRTSARDSFARPSELKTARLEKSAIHDIVSHASQIRADVHKFHFDDEGALTRRLDILEKLDAMEAPTIHDLITLSGVREVNGLGGTKYQF